MYEPILDLVETALLEPERIFVLLLEKGKEEPVTRASRVKGSRPGDSLALSRTMMQQVLEEKKSFLTSDPLNDPGFGGMMSMVRQGIRSAIAVPLFDNEDVIGLLYADDSRAGQAVLQGPAGGLHPAGQRDRRGHHPRPLPCAGRGEAPPGRRAGHRQRDPGQHPARRCCRRARATT